MTRPTQDTAAEPEPAREVTAETLTWEDLQDVLDAAHMWPMDVRHAASCVKFSPGATQRDRQVVATAINARRRG